MSLMRQMVEALGAFGLVKVDRNMLVQRRLEPCGQEYCQQDDREYLAPPFSHGATKLIHFPANNATFVSQMKKTIILSIACLLAGLTIQTASAQSRSEAIDSVKVTATRIPVALHSSARS